MEDYGMAYFQVRAVGFRECNPAKVLQFNNEGLTQLPEAAHGIGQVAEVLFGFDA